MTCSHRSTRTRCASGSCRSAGSAPRRREVAHLNVLEAFTLRDESPQLVLALVEARFPTGTHEVYQVPDRHPARLRGLERARDRRGRRQHLLRRARRPRARARAAAPDARRAPTCRRARGCSRSAGPAAPGEGGTVDVRPVGVEQSNSSIVFGEALILKAFRRVEPGVNPELELLRFLSERDFPHIAPIAGWFQYDGRLMDATLGVLQEYLAGAQDGWELALDALAPRSRGVPRPGARARRRHRRAAHRARLGGVRPGVRARGAEHRGDLDPHRDDRRGDRADLRRAPRRPGDRPDPRPRPGRAGAAADARGGRHRAGA